MRHLFSLSHSHLNSIHFKEKVGDRPVEKVVDRLAEKKPGKTTGQIPSADPWHTEGPSQGRNAPSTSANPPGLDISDFTLLQKGHRTTPIQKARVIEATYSCNSKKVRWADEVGSALTQTAMAHSKDSALAPVPRYSSIIRRIDTSIPEVRKRYVKSLAKCLGFSHRAAKCREPIRCRSCFKTGHLARACMDRPPLHVYRAMRARPSYLSAFVPLTDDFFVRQNRSRNAILVDVLPPKNLGHFPQETIAIRLAGRFGGFPSDFHVARYSERDFIIFLPEKALLTYNVWIRLVSLPYECWSSRTVAVLVGGFGRFIRADDFTVRMEDLTSYRCLISVNHLSDIPENLEITVGDLSLSVLIQLDRWGGETMLGTETIQMKGRIGLTQCRDNPKSIAT
uniref:CCHC-type domain-containing protein n=1 Tax=Ananas comosus var. bracteatus TaxID=296719 RepID=A0A6V7QDQ9_ANACO|nr:unnamed protein product [Ananas comosus var. bracteatus]